MGNDKVVVIDNIPIEVWRYIEEQGIISQAKLFDEIFRSTNKVVFFHNNLSLVKESLLLIYLIDLFQISTSNHNILPSLKIMNKMHFIRHCYSLITNSIT